MAAGRLTIDLDALVANWRAMAAAAPSAETAAVVKADAYGIGIGPAVAALSRAGCRTFFVALPGEGLQARAIAPEAVIYVLGGLVGPPESYAAAGLRPVLNSVPEAAEWARFRARGTGDARAAIHIDTGMNRLGLRPAEVASLAAGGDLAGRFALSLVMSHLACADVAGHPLNRGQLADFATARAVAPGVAASLANSAGILLGPGYHFDLVRPGIALYGARAADGTPPLRPVVTLEARVLQVRTAEPGETVGYGAGETLRRPSRIAVVGVGYADGYHRRAGGSDQRAGAEGFVHGKAVPILGRVSMDLIAFDATDVPEIARGDWIELFGPNVAVDDVADRAGTIGYELLTGLGTRYERRYRGGPGLTAE